MSQPDVNAARGTVVVHRYGPVRDLMGKLRGAPVRRKKADGQDEPGFRSAEAEDTPEGLMLTENQIITPPYDLQRLERMLEENNILGPCVAAMVTNVDGTGWVIEKTDGTAPTAEEEKEIKALSSFFNEPAPDESFTTIRKKMRRDLESMGNGYLEVIRDLESDVAMLRYVDAKLVELVRLDEPVPVVVELERDGKKIKVQTLMRERRFAQRIGSSIQYFREFGTSRQLNRKTGKWVQAGEVVSPEDLATELMWFKLEKNWETPYGIPRWIGQLPAVLGSRLSELLNLQFFDAGGVPPIMVIVQGGKLAQDAADTLKQHFSSRTNKHQVAVLEAYGTVGSLDTNPQVRVQVERFGADRQQDAMFKEYEKRTGELIRRSFRLPPLFTGETQDFSFATAFASYTVAEAQVFAPERHEFDEAINLKIVRKLPNGEKYRFRSLPLNVKDAVQQLEAIRMAAAEKAIDREELVRALNEAVDLELKPSEEPEEEEAEFDEFGQPIENGRMPEQESQPREPPTRKQAVFKEASELISLADRVSRAMEGGLRNKETAAELGKLMLEVSKLDPNELKTFQTVLATKVFASPQHDLTGLREMIGCSLMLLTPEP